LAQVVFSGLLFFSGKNPVSWPSKINVLLNKLKVMKTNNEITSASARADVKKLFNALVVRIKNYLNNNEELEFEENVNLSYKDEEIRLLMKHDNSYLIVTIDNQNGAGFNYDISNPEYLSIEDLIWIVEQIENEERGQ
jgi:hypothetical protein